MSRGRRVVLGALVLMLAIVFLPPLGARIFGWGIDPGKRPPPGRNVAIGDDLTLNVTEIGSGTPVVLVHGLPSCAADWALVPAKLAALGHRVIVYDRTGFGYSSRPDPTPDRYTYSSNARDLTALLESLDVERAALVGWSYGGAVVQTVAQQHPDRVSRLVLLAAVGPAQPTDQDDLLSTILRSRLAVPVFDWLAAVPPLSRRMIHDSLVQVFGSAAAIPPGWTEYTMAMLALPRTLRSFVLEAQRDDVSSLHPESLHMPALILQGTDDQSVPRVVGEDLHRRLPQSRLVLVPHGSHMLPVTHPDLVAEQIHTFLAE